MFEEQTHKNLVNPPLCVGSCDNADNTTPRLYVFLCGLAMEKERKSICWRPKNALIECIIATKCFEEKQTIEGCVAASECFLERRNWTLCKVNAVNPRYRLRGNPYDVATEDQKKIEARDERIRRRELENEGLA